MMNETGFLPENIVYAFECLFEHAAPTDIETFAEVKGRNKLFSLPPVELQKELDGVQGVREDRRG